MFTSDAMRNLPTSDNDKYHASYTSSKVCVHNIFFELALTPFSEGLCSARFGSALTDFEQVGRFERNAVGMAPVHWPSSWTRWCIKV